MIESRARRLLRGTTLWTGVGLAGLVAPGSAGAITGVCPDGSIYIVQHASQVPCKAGKEVAPHEVPPLKPGYLPKPYTWQVWNELNDPNNPYNLIDSARQVRELNTAPFDAQLAGPQGAQPTPDVASAPPVEASLRPLDLGLSDQELRDLFLIVELAQQAAPARLVRRTADGQGVFEVSFARSLALEERLEAAWRSRGGLEGGPVLVFTARSKAADAFWANLTFVQDHMTFQPDLSEGRQGGLLQGRLGELEADELVMGYVVLPAAMDLDADIDIYWNDRRTTALFGS